jgi:hypothetical protein
VFVGLDDGCGILRCGKAVQRRIGYGRGVLRDLGNSARVGGLGRVRWILGGHYLYLSVGCPNAKNAATKRTQKPLKPKGQAIWRYVLPANASII